MRAIKRDGAVGECATIVPRTIRQRAAQRAGVQLYTGLKGEARVRGHSGNKEYERCDQLAKQAAQRPGLPADEGYESGAYPLPKCLAGGQGSEGISEYRLFSVLDLPSEHFPKLIKNTCKKGLTDFLCLSYDDHAPRS